MDHRVPVGLRKATTAIFLWVLLVASAKDAVANGELQNGPDVAIGLSAQPPALAKGASPGFQCNRRGSFPVPGSCKHFYQCVELPGQGIRPILFACPTGTLFDKNLGVCNLPSQAANEGNCSALNEDSITIGDIDNFPPTGISFSDTRTLRRQKREPITLSILGVGLTAASLGVGIYNAFRKFDNGIDLSVIQSKLIGIDAQLRGVNLQLFMSKMENEVSSKITQDLLKKALMDNQENYRDTQDLIHMGISQSNINAAIIQGLIVQGNADNDQQFSEVRQSIGKLKELIGQEIAKAKSEIQRGYERASTAIEQLRIEPIVSTLFTIIKEFEHRLHHVLSLPDKNRKDEMERSDGYINYLETSTLEGTLRDIIHQKLAIPRSHVDTSAGFIMDLLVDGLQIHASMLSSIVSSNAYLAVKAHEERNLEEFNTYMLRVSSSISRMKLNLGFETESGLSQEVNAVMHDIKQLPFTYQITGLEELISEKQSTMSQLETRISTFIKDHTQLDEPEQIMGRPDFTASTIPLPFGPWERGTKVSYAIQIASRQGISPVGMWSRPYTVLDKANPIVYLPRVKEGETRLIFRKFEEEKPELVAIVTDKAQDSFRDIGRDLINAASRLNQDLAVTEVKHLIEDGADVSITLENDMMPLQYAAKYNNMEVMELLINEGADIHYKSSDNQTAIHYAALLGNSDALEYLINEGAHINEQTALEGWSPLHIASAKDQVGAAKILIRNKAQINIKDHMDLTPLHLSVLGNGEIMGILLAENDTEVNARDNEGQTPLHHVARSCSAENALQLLDHNDIEVDALDNSLMSPLHCAAMTGNVDIIQELLYSNASLSLADEGGSTPLHYAAFYGHDEATLLLTLQNEELITVENKEGKTALDLAIENNQDNVLWILRDDTEMPVETPEGTEGSATFPIADMPENEYSLEAVNCTQETVQEMATQSEETCAQMGHITHYIKIVMSKLPVPIRQKEEDALRDILDNYNEALQKAKTNANRWRNADSILGGIERTFESAKAFEESFNRMYKIKEENVLAMSNNTEDESQTAKIKEKISGLENQIRGAKLALALAAAPEIKQYLQIQIRHFEAELQTKQTEISTDPVTSLKLEELLYFLELVSEEAKKIKLTATDTKQRINLFTNNVYEDKESFDAIGQTAKTKLRSLESQSLRNNAELMSIHGTQEQLEAEVEAHKRKVKSLFDEMYNTQRGLREKRRELLQRFEKASLMRYASILLAPLFFISRPLLMHATTEERRVIDTWQRNMATIKSEAARIKSLIKDKEQAIVQHREIIANGSRNSQTLVRELNTFNRIDYELNNIIVELPSLQPSLAQAKAGVQKIEEVFTHITQALTEMIDEGKAAKTSEEMKSVLQSIHARLTTIQCYWKGSNVYITDMTKCSKN